MWSERDYSPHLSNPRASGDALFESAPGFVARLTIILANYNRPARPNGNGSSRSSATGQHSLYESGNRREAGEIQITKGKKLVVGGSVPDGGVALPEYSDLMKDCLMNKPER